MRRPLDIAMLLASVGLVPVDVEPADEHIDAMGSARKMLDRLRALGVDIDGPGYSLQRPFAATRGGRR